MSAPVKAGLAHNLQPPTGRYQWVYLWGWPIRAMHWTAALCIVVLVVTGFYIGRPYFMSSGEASAHFLMGKVRFWHFAAAGLLVATAIVRTYWLFMGNQFERLRALFPVRGRDWGNLWRMVKFYLLVDEEGAPKYLGHNPLQQFSYTGMYLVAAVMAITGFAMYGQAAPEGFFYTMFNWVVRLLGGIQRVHFVHHIFTWIFLIFIPIHIYLALRADTLERTGTISSIVSGGRFVNKEETYVDE
ncbi:MAG TPA: Ni/Fe-hydrogenase, b-type cytochrome subunit [Gemmatimonadales bacterium]|nr:Ni/Fe-hydrogenase, b-type cytochrome subunit [Gemmatimonadales bacterium]